MTFKLTSKQLEAQKILTTSATHLMLFGGSRSGKTALHCRNIITRALIAPESRHGIFRLRYNAIKASIQQDTLPKIFRLAFPGVKYELNRSDSIFYLPNGSEIRLFGMDNEERVEKVLGLEFATIYFNECSEIKNYSKNLVLSRLAQKVKKIDGEYLPLRAYYDMNPGKKSHWTHKYFIEKINPDSKLPLTDKENYSAFQINPKDNLENISANYLKEMEDQSEAYKRRFRDGNFSEDNPDALFKEDTLDACRIDASIFRDFERIIIGVDPSGAFDNSKKNDAIGIVVVGLCENIAYILADLSINSGPNEWSKVIADAYNNFAADLVVGEVNYGGAMVEQVIKTHNPNIPFKAITSTRGKHLRIEPVSNLYIQGKVKHIGYYPELEEELQDFSSQGYTGARSPNRADALVFAIQEIFNNITSSKPDTSKLIKPETGLRPVRQSWMRT